MFEQITTLLASSAILLSPLAGGDVLMEKSLNLTNRQPDPWVNEVFADNIVLTLRYLQGDPLQNRPASEQEWKKVREPFETSFTLKPGETFAFQDAAPPQLEGKVVKTTNATFNYAQGFRSSGYLMGDGVCHLASFINQTAREAGLEVVGPVNHDFRAIPDIPREFGTSIFHMPGNPSANSQQNLYVTNSFDSDVVFLFKAGHDKITLKMYLK